MPFHHEPILAGRTGFEPVDFCADNAARTQALSRPLEMVRARGFEPRLTKGWASRLCRWARLGWSDGPLGMVPTSGLEPLHDAGLGRAPLPDWDTSGWCRGRDSNPHCRRSQRRLSAWIGVPRHGASGWIRTTASSVKSRACCIDTTEAWSRHTGSNRDLRLTKAAGAPCTPWRLERVSGFEPPSSAWKAEALPLDDTRNGAAVAHHGRSTSLDNHRLSKTSAIAAGRHTYGAGLATAPGLEPGPTSFGGSDAPLHHAADRAIASQFQQTQPPCDLTRAISRVRPKTQKAFQGVAPEGLFLDECRPFRALRLPCRSRCRACRHDGRTTVVSWISTRVRPPTARWPNRMAAPSMSTANWRIESSIQPRSIMYERIADLSMGN